MVQQIYSMNHNGYHDDRLVRFRYRIDLLLLRAARFGVVAVVVVVVDDGGLRNLNSDSHRKQIFLLLHLLIFVYVRGY